MVIGLSTSDDVQRVGTIFAREKLGGGCAIIELGKTRGRLGYGSIALALELLLPQGLLLPQVATFTPSEQHAETRAARGKAHFSSKDLR